MEGILLRRSGLLMRRFSEYRLSALRTSAGLLLIGMMAHAQFKEIGSAPFPPAEAHQKIRALLDQVDSAGTGSKPSKRSSVGSPGTGMFSTRN